jgi:hypothetical protein
MINFIDGKVIVGNTDILANSISELDILATKGLIEKRKDAVGHYYCLEDGVNTMRFRIIIDLDPKKIRWLRLHWLGSSMKGWDDASVKAVKTEYRLLLKIVEENVGRPPDIKKNSEQTWLFKWGHIDVSFDLRSFQADIFMVPKCV